MRLWTVHPQYLDYQGLVAAWREALLAQQVLLGKTKGYRNHPQLWRFRQAPNPPALIATYLQGLCEEAVKRAYNFDQSKIAQYQVVVQLTETEGQLLYEWQHLKQKMFARSPFWHNRFIEIQRPDSHPIFKIVAGGIAGWERLNINNMRNTNPQGT